MSPYRAREADDARRLYWWGFALRFGIGCLVLSLAAFIDTPLLEDALYYEQVGAGIAADWLAGHQSQWLHNAIASGTVAWVLPALIGCLYWVLGGLRATYVLVALMSAITALTPVLIYRLALSIGTSRRAAMYAGRLVVFSPCFAFWSGALYKDGLVLLLMALGLLQILRLQSRWSTMSFLVLGAVIPLLFGLRFYMAFFLVIAFVLAMAIGAPSRASAGIPGRRLFIAAGFLVVLVGLGFTQRVRRILPDNPAAAFAQVETTRSDLAQSSSGYLRDVSAKSGLQVIRLLPVGVFYFLTEPLPWHLGSLRQSLVIPETFAWLILYPFVFIGMRRSLKYAFHTSVVVIATTVVVSVFYGLLVGNVGTAYRLRAQVWLLWSIFAAVGMEYWRRSRSGALPPSQDVDDDRQAAT